VSDLVWCEQVRRWGLRGAVRCRRGVRTWDADDGVGACAVLMCWGTAVERRRQRRPVHALSHFTRSAHVRPRRPAHEGRPPLGRLLPTVRACRPRRDRVKARLRRFCTSRLDRRGADMSTRLLSEPRSRCASCSWGHLPSLLHHTTRHGAWSANLLPRGRVLPGVVWRFGRLVGGGWVRRRRRW
jgi:hypothetical protein